MTHLAGSSACRPVRWTAALAALTALASSPAAQDPAVASSAEPGPPHFVEVPGGQEFTGVLLARPLQPEHAAERGLSQAALEARANAARDRLAQYELVRYVVETDEFLFRVPEGATENSVARQLLATGDFQYVEPDWLVFPIECPDDAQFASQWHHATDRLRSCDAWNLETGDPNIVVALCDTGIRITHEDLQLHRREAYHVPSGTWENAGAPIHDVHGHGTNVTGTAAGNGNNGIGIAGVGWNLGHRMMRVTDSPGGSAPLSNLTNAARTAADSGDKVASVSYTGVTSAGVDTAGEYVRSQGALLVWAAGNSSSNLQGPRDDNVIVVGATNPADQLASFSSFGPFVDLTAPGVDVLTTANQHDAAYSAVDGTSFACPLTAGLCALIWSRDPLLSPEEVEEILRASCDDLGAPGIDNTFGHGRINLFNAMELTSLGSRYCSPSNPNSSGLSATIRADGSRFVEDNDVTLLAENLPPGEFGYFLVGVNQGAFQPPGSAGVVCLSCGGYQGCSGIGRYNHAGEIVVGPTGTLTLDLDALPTTPNTAVQPGDTWNFQCWFRDLHTNNFTDAIAITFL
ncbi:MAG: S8 family serine peptidase [bacterium]|nr:S8 family serine peptidase [bacterium]